MFLFACGGAQTQATVTIAATVPSPSATVAVPASSSSTLTTHATGPQRIPGTSIRFTGGDGTSMKSAIVILGAKGEQDGTGAEYKYLDLLLPDVSHTVRGQALLEDSGRSYDRLDVQLTGGKSMTVFFDITDYFGKF
jgi:hypothetical protein